MLQIPGIAGLTSSSPLSSSAGHQVTSLTLIIHHTRHHETHDLKALFTQLVLKNNLETIIFKKTTGDGFLVNVKEG